MYITLIKENNLIFESRSKESQGVMLKNVLNNGYTDDQFEIKEVTDSEYSDLLLLEINQGNKKNKAWEGTSYLLDMLEENNIITTKQKNDFKDKIKTEKKIDI